MSVSLTWAQMHTFFHWFWLYSCLAFFFAICLFTSLFLSQFHCQSLFVYFSSSYINSTICLSVCVFVLASFSFSLPFCTVPNCLSFRPSVSERMTTHQHQFIETSFIKTQNSTVLQLFQKQLGVICMKNDQNEILEMMPRILGGNLIYSTLAYYMLCNQWNKMVVVWLAIWAASSVMDGSLLLISTTPTNGNLFC